MAITVSGIGVASGVPDTVEVDLGVSVLADTVAAANETAAERGQVVISALTAGGIPESDMTTSDYTIQPEYDYSGNERRMIGYRVGNMVRAKVRDVRRVGQIIDSVTAAGADHTEIDGIRFGMEDDTALQAAAREAAWNDAVARATQLAALSGQRLGPATSIRETAKSPVAPVRMMADMAMAERAPTQIQPGTSVVMVTLEVVFALES
jgi:uncharacterized protein YggE